MHFPAIPCALVVLVGLPLMGQKAKRKTVDNGWATIANFQNATIIWKPSTLEFFKIEPTNYNPIPQNYLKAWFKFIYPKPLNDKTKSVTSLIAFRGNYECAIRTIAYDANGLVLSDNTIPGIAWAEIVPDTFAEIMSKAIKEEAVKRGLIISIDNI